MTTPSPFLELPGAIRGGSIDADLDAETPADVDAPVAAHYGGLFAEQRPLAAGKALVDCSHLGIIRLGGADRLTWLNSITSQELDRLRPGDSAESLVLDVQGRIEHAFGIIEDGDAAWLITEPTHVDALAAWLTRMRFRMDVTIDIVTDDVAAVATIGEPAFELSAWAPSGRPLVWNDPWAAPPAGGTTYSQFRDNDWAHPGHEFPLRLYLVQRDALADLAARARSGEFKVSGMLALEALRVAAWRPRLARDVDSRTLPHELDWLRSAVHLSKGCYRGQETVAKVHNLGHPPRRLVRLDLDGSLSILPAPGAMFYVAGDEAQKPIARVSSVATHIEDGPLALALVKRTIDPEATLETLVDGRPIAASQTVIVGVNAGREVEVPKLPRLHRRDGNA